MHTRLQAIRVYVYTALCKVRIWESKRGIPQERECSFRFWPYLATWSNGFFFANKRHPTLAARWNLVPLRRILPEYIYRRGCERATIYTATRLPPCHTYLLINRSSFETPPITLIHERLFYWNFIQIILNLFFKKKDYLLHIIMRCWLNLLLRRARSEIYI